MDNEITTKREQRWTSISSSRGRNITRSSAALAPVPASLDESSIPAAFRDLIGYHLRIAQEASFQAIRQGAAGAEIKPGWYTVLTLIHDSPGLTPSELSRCCGRDRSTLTGTLKDLAARGLISRRRKPADQRSYGVRLTAKGTEMLAGLRVHSRHHDQKLDGLVGADKALLLAILRRIAGGLKQETEEMTP